MSKAVRSLEVVQPDVIEHCDVQHAVDQTVDTVSWSSLEKLQITSPGRQHLHLCTRQQHTIKQNE